ncbi:MAG: hypothetical protein ACPHWZ_04510 [Longimicrobiales bacterium]
MNSRFFGPEEERTALTGPQPGHLVEELQVRVRIIRDVPVFEAIAEEGGTDAQTRSQEKPEDGVDAPFGTEDEIPPQRPAAGVAQNHAPRGHRQ